MWSVTGGGHQATDDTDRLSGRCRLREWSADPCRSSESTGADAADGSHFGFFFRCRAFASTFSTPSSNWNRYALTEHRQADVCIQEASIGTFYADYFDALWSETLSSRDVKVALPDDFGIAPTVLPLADLPDAASYVHVLLQLLGQAERSIHVTMYRMSYYSGYSDSLANELIHALIDAAHRGLDVKVLLDDCAYYEDSAEANLTSAILLHQRGVEVRLDDPGLTTHAKLVVIDGKTVLLGSTNWNYYSLEKNCETNIVFAGLPEVAAPFEAYFHALWTSGRELAP